MKRHIYASPFVLALVLAGAFLATNGQAATTPADTAKWAAIWSTKMSM